MLEQIKQALEEYEKAGVELHPNAHQITHNFHANSAGFIRYLIGEVERLKEIDERESLIAINIRNENKELKKEFQKVNDDYKALIAIMDRARKLAFLAEEEEEPGPRFKMDANGNLTRIERSEEE